MVSGQSFGSSAVSLACITSMCSVQCFRGGHSLRLAFGSIFYPHPSPPLILSLLTGAWFHWRGGSWLEGVGLPAIYEGVTLSRGWLCQRWKRLDIPGTHLHSATQLLNVINYYFEENNDKHTIEWNTV